MHTPMFGKAVKTQIWNNLQICDLINMIIKLSGAPLTFSTLTSSFASEEPPRCRVFAKKRRTLSIVSSRIQFN